MDLTKLGQSITDGRKSLNDYSDSDQKTHLNLCLIALTDDLNRVKGRATSIEKRVNEIKFRIKNELQQHQRG